MSEPDPYVHVVGTWQGLLDRAGRLFPTLIRQLAPEAPKALCGTSLVVTDADDSDPIDGQHKPTCPTCLG